MLGTHRHSAGNACQLEMYSVSLGVWNGVMQLLQRLDANITFSLASLRKELNCSPWPYPTLFPSTWVLILSHCPPWPCTVMLSTWVSIGSCWSPWPYLILLYTWALILPLCQVWLYWILGAALHWLEAQGLHYGKRDLSNSSSSLWFKETCCLLLSPVVLVILESLLRLL